MSESGEETSDTGSPVLKTGPMVENESASESSESDQEESSSESDRNPETIEKPAIVPMAPKHSSVPKPKPKPQPRPMHPAIAKMKSYDVMVLDAMNALNENKKAGVSIIRLLKYVRDNMVVRENFKSYFFKRAVDKALKAETFVHTSGVGMTGSIAFSAGHKKLLRQEEKKKEKDIKAAEKKAALKTKTKAKAKPKPKNPAKSKEPQQDKNNNIAMKKPTAKAKKARLSIPLLPTIKAKAKPKPKTVAKPKTNARNAEASQGKTKAAPSKEAGPNATTRTAAGKGKAVKAKT